MVSMRRLCCVKIMDTFGSHNSVSTAKDLAVLGIHSQQQASVLLLEVISRENQSQLRNSFEAQKKQFKLAFPEIT